jgi:TM2 domain-containing membrane protein YozV
MNNINSYIKKSKSTTILLCLIGFIGVAGLHRIYTGHVLSGIIFLVTGGLLGIGTIFDLLNLIFDVFEDKAGYKLG